MKSRCYRYLTKLTLPSPRYCYLFFITYSRRHCRVYTTVVNVLIIHIMERGGGEYYICNFQFSRMSQKHATAKWKLLNKMVKILAMLRLSNFFVAVICVHIGIPCRPIKYCTARCLSIDYSTFRPLGFLRYPIIVHKIYHLMYHNG